MASYLHQFPAPVARRLVARLLAILALPSRSCRQGIVFQGPPWAVGFFEENVPIDSHVELVAWRNLDRGLNVEILARDLGTELAHLSACRALRLLSRAR